MEQAARVRRAFLRALVKALPHQDKRILEAWLLVSSGHVRLQRPLSASSCVAEVTSAETGEVYEVRYCPRRGEWTCTCPDMSYRGQRRGHKCKHIQATSWVWGSVREAV